MWPECTSFCFSCCEAPACPSFLMHSSHLVDPKIRENKLTSYVLEVLQLRKHYYVMLRQWITGPFLGKPPGSSLPFTLYPFSQKSTTLLLESTAERLVEMSQWENMQDVSAESWAASLCRGDTFGHAFHVSLCWLSWWHAIFILAILNVHKPFCKLHSACTELHTCST